MRYWIAAGACAAVLVVAAVALAAPGHSGNLSASTTSYEWNGTPTLSSQLTYSPASGGPCTTSGPFDACDQTLLNVDATSATLKVGVAASTFDNFDLYVYKSDASGAPGAQAGSSAQAAPAAESVTVTGATGYYLVNIVYANAAAADAPHGTATVSDLPAPAVTPTPTPTAAATETATPASTQTPAPTPAATTTPAPTPAATATPRPSQPFLVHFAILPRTTQKVARRGLAGRLGCAAPCSASVVARWKGRTIKRARYSLDAAGRRSFHLRFSRSVRRKLVRSKRAALVVTAQVSGDGAPTRTYVQRPILFPAVP